MALMTGLPFPQWPSIDQQLFTAGLRQASRRTRHGPVIRRSEATKSGWRTEYGIGLNWLKNEGFLNFEEAPTVRWSPDRLASLVEHMLAKEYRLTSIHTRVGRIKRALSIMEPKANLDYFGDLLRELERPTPRFDPIVLRVNTYDLKQLGVDLMEGAKTSSDLPPIARSELYRAGLQIAVLACRPWRRRTFTIMVLWEHLKKFESAWHMSAPPEDTKNWRHLSAWVPADLNPYIDDYVGMYRRILSMGASADSNTNALWLTADGLPQTKEAFYRDYCHHTRNRFGQHITLQQTRQIAATTIAIFDPKNVQAIQGILGQAGPEVGEQFYNLAGSVSAINALDAAIDNISKRKSK